MTDFEVKLPPESLLQLVTDHWTHPFWDAARQHRLTAAQCADCGHFRMPPTPFCPHCRSQRLNWPELSGRGTLYSFTVVRRLALNGAEAHLPYAPCVIELDNAPGARLISNMTSCRISDLKIGRAVKIAWRDHADGTSSHYFTFAEDDT